MNSHKDDFLKTVNQRRTFEAVVSEKYDFDHERCRILTTCKETKKSNRGIIYYMQRDCRVQDNWAMIYAQMLAFRHRVSLHVCFFAKQWPLLYPTLRQFKFLCGGLKALERDCRSHGIHFYFINETPAKLTELVQKNNIGAVVTDFFPLRALTDWLNYLKKELPKDVPLFQVDAHNIVPAWVASDHEETAAKTIRPKITKLLPRYLVEFPTLGVCDSSVSLELDGMMCDFEEALKDFVPKVDAIEGPEVDWAKPGTSAGMKNLKNFIDHHLKNYENRNNPENDCTSKMSPWLHFGQVSAQRVALEVQRFKSRYGKSVESFLEELIIRRELTDNFCFYNENYDNLKGAKKWAYETLQDHSTDERSYLYTKMQFARAQTHDPLWNAAQRQLLIEGRIHNYMRMYWCKKILEWTSSPEEALEIALYLNDTYSLDGNDPNGYVGIMWSICGIHDQGWKERQIFGKIRYMVDYSLVRKFGMEGYKRKYRTWPGSDSTEADEQSESNVRCVRSDDEEAGSAPKKKSRAKKKTKF